MVRPLTLIDPIRDKHNWYRRPLRPIGLGRAIRRAEVRGRIDHAFAVRCEVSPGCVAMPLLIRFTFEPSMFIVKI